MARRERRDADAVDQRLDQDTDEALDEAAVDEDALDDDLEDVDDLDDDDLDPTDDLDEEAEPSRRRGGTAVKRVKADTGAKARSKTRPGTRAEKEKEKPKRPARVGPIGRLIRFIREVVAELRKVNWPTRKELITYTTVVVFFVAVMLAIIALMDYGVARAMLFVFGSTTAEE